MKKMIALLICMAMLAALSACISPAAPSKEPAAQTPATDTPAANKPEQTPEVAESMEKTGVAIATGVNGSASASQQGDGKAQTDSTIVAVTVDESGVINRCMIDAAQTVINFSSEGKLTTDPAATFQTKQELGAGYGMAAASGIGKEWNEQVDALASYVVGKTADEVRGIALTETTAAADEQLTASCTVSIGGFIEVIAKAAENATALGASADDRIGIGVATDMGKSKDATAEENGLAQAYSTYAVATVNSDGVITSCIIDASQADVNFDIAGQISGNTSTPVATKNELGAGYGMAAASGIGKEWNEQAAAFAVYCVGKTAGEVRGVAMDGSGLAKDADLLASVTIHIGDFINVVAKAAANAK